MKKRVCLIVLVISLVAGLAACGGGGRAPDALAIACTENGRTVTLGDDRAAFDRAFGEPEDIGHDNYVYLDGALEVGFENDRATGFQVNAYPHPGRIELPGLSWEMTLEELHEKLIATDFMSPDGGFFNQFFDSNGNEVPQEESAYTMVIAYFAPAGMTYMVLHESE